MILLSVQAGTALLLAFAQPAAAVCIAPAPPDVAGRPAKPVPPARPACADAKSGTPGCLGWESFSYNEEVKAFNEKAKTWKVAADAYVAKLNAYVQASSEYARCEVNALQ